MEELMKRYEPIVEHFVTEREGRWVLPVGPTRTSATASFTRRAAAARRSSSSPRAVIPMGNRLKVLEAEVRREEEAAYAHG